MRREKITDHLVRTLAAPAEGKQRIIRDRDLVGFGVRKTATGCTAFIMQYVINGRERRITIGQYPAWSVAAARDEAKRLRRLVDIGRDPLDERTLARAEQTLGDLWEMYSDEVMPKKAISSQRNERSIWERLILPELAQRKLSAIQHRDLQRLHDRISLTTPAQANRCSASLRHVFATAMKWGLCAANPAAGLQRNVELGRERYLSSAEKDRFLAVLGSRPDTASTLAIKFLLLTGARSGEVFSATWDQFDIEAAVWVKPSSHTKQRRLHRVPLSTQAIAVLERAAQLSTGDVVFGGKEGKRLTTVKSLFRNVCREAKLDDFRVHDLRHTFASFLVSEGASLPIIGRLLGHTQVSTTNRYSHLEDDTLRDAANRIARKVMNDGSTR